MEADEKEYIKKIREQVDSYERTIQAIIAFDSAVRWDDAQRDYLSDSYFLPGRRLSRSPNGLDNTVTPDVVVQLSNDYGIVAEVKITASTKQDFLKAYEQIGHYDADLVGWKTANERISLHDLSLLVDDLKKNTAKGYFVGRTFQKNFILIACALISEAHDYFKIEKYYGSFSNPNIERKLGGDPVGIPLDKIVEEMSRAKFYDAEPPVEHTMIVLWMNIFNELMEEKKGKKTGKNILVNTGEATEKLEKAYSFPRADDRQPKVPREAWIRQALDAFVEIGYASKDSKDRDIYNVKYSYQRKESMLTVFTRKRYSALTKSRRKIEEGRQLEFNNFKT